MIKAIIILLLCCSLSYGQESKDSTSQSMTSRKLELYGLITNGDQALSKGELVQAEEYYKQGTVLADKLINEGTSPRISILIPTIYDTFDRLGYLYLTTNNLNKSELYFQESRKRRDKALPKRSIFRVPPMVGLGELYLAKQDFAKANMYFISAEKMYNNATTSFYNYSHIQKSILFNKFESSLKSADYKSSKKIIEKLSTGGMFGDPNIPRVFEMKARYYLYIGDYEKCRYYIDRGKKFSSATEASLTWFKLLKCEALLEWTSKDIAAATIVFNTLILTYQDYIARNFASMSEYERESFYATLKDDFDLFNAFVVENFSADNASSLYKTLYNNQLFSKALLLNQISKFKSRIVNGSDSDLKVKLQEWENAKSRLSTLYYNRTKNINEIEIIEAKIQSLERELNEKSGLIGSMNTEITWKDVQKNLNDNEAAIEIIRVRKFQLSDTQEMNRFAFSDSVNYVFLLVSKTNNSPKGHLVKNGNELEGRYLNYYRNAIKYKGEDINSYNNYWSPLKTLVGDYIKAYISSDGVYNQINLNTLKNPETNKYLLDEIDLIFLTNTKDLIENRKDKTGAKEAYLYGRPKYLITGQVRSNDQVYVKSQTLRTIRSEVFEHFKEQEFTDLPATEDEVKNIEELLEKNQWNTSSFFDENASEYSIKENKNPYVLHIASHGFFLPSTYSNEVNSMIRSGIILAGVNNNTDSQQDDGILTAYEATNLSLDSTYLVVLSACETGLGEVKNGEGVYGLQRGFIVAGTRYLLMSLWKVDDFATRLFMENFYINWIKESDIHTAIKKTQQELRKDYPHPVYWGAFVLLGN